MSSKFILSEHFTERMKKNYVLKERDTGEFQRIDKSGMHFRLKAYETPVGNFSVLTMKAMLGLMKMDTVVFTPFTVDAPLFSFDYVRAMGNDTLIFEIYDTQLGSVELSGMEKVKSAYTALKNHDLGKHWYDYMKLPVSVSKKEKGKTAEYMEMARKYMDAYAEVLQAASPCDKAEKQKKAAEYTQGLLKNGGPSTDRFIKMIGKDATEQLFCRFVFSSEA